MRIRAEDVLNKYRHNPRSATEHVLANAGFERYLSIIKLLNDKMLARFDAWHARNPMHRADCKCTMRRWYFVPYKFMRTRCAAKRATSELAVELAADLDQMPNRR